MGLVAFGGNRRVPGLRREELAMLAGVSVDYYTRIERGNLRGVSESVLHALAEALRLDDVERAHLFDLARTAGESSGPGSVPPLPPHRARATAPGGRARDPRRGHTGGLAQP